jgi:hypothetical protein
MNHGSVDLDPLIGLEDERMPLRGRLLKLPHFKAQYLEHVREIAEQDLDWQHLGTIVAAERALIEEAVKADTRKLGTTDDFLNATSPEPAKTPSASPDERPRGMSLRDFAEKRRKYLLEYKEPEKKPEQKSG